MKTSTQQSSRRPKLTASRAGELSIDKALCVELLPKALADSLAYITYDDTETYVAEVGKLLTRAIDFYRQGMFYDSLNEIHSLYEAIAEFEATYVEEE